MFAGPYQLLQPIGEGNSCEVYRARHRHSGQLVAVKRLHREQDKQLGRQEARLMIWFSHPCIVKLVDVLEEDGQLNLVYELFGENLLELYSASKHGLNENQIRCIVYQVALALQHVHQKGILHRDIKPQNILIDRKTGLIKLIDFGSAKETVEAETDYICTRWYRAPECLLGMKVQSVAVDVFALGCICVELLTQRPLFPGEDTIDQLNRIFNVLGSPSPDEWPEGYREIKKRSFQFPQKLRIPLSNFLPDASQEFCELIDDMLWLDPTRRIKPLDILHHEFFEGVDVLLPPVVQRYVRQDLQRKHDQDKSVRITEQPCISIGTRRCRVKLTEEDIKCLKKMVLTHTSFLKKSSQSRSKSRQRAPSSYQRSPDHTRSPLQNLKNKPFKAGSKTPENLEKYQSKARSYVSIHKNEQAPSQTSSPIRIKGHSPAKQFKNIIVGPIAANRPASSYRPDQAATQRNGSQLHLRLAH